MNTRVSLLIATCVVLMFGLACGGGSIGGTKGTTTFTIGGAVTGLSSGASVVLADNVTDTVTVTSNTAFRFTTAIAAGGAYSVTVKTQPTGESCTVTNASGVANANVTNVSVSCTATSTFSIGGTLTGLASGASVVLADNGSADSLTLTAVGTFTFAKKINSGSPYAVTVTTQPTGQTCTVTNGSGTATGNVTNVAVACTSAPTLTIGGTVSGLPSATSVILADNGSFDTVTVSANGTFTFPKSISSGSAYAVTVTTQPTGATCSVSNGSGTATANVTNVSVSCTPAPTFTIGGTVSGLPSATSVILADNGSFDALTVSANGAFTFPKSITSGSAYAVTVTTQPSGATCTVTNGSGTATANVTNVTVSCTPASTFTIGGTLSGLPVSTSIVLADNGSFDTLTVSANGAFTFPKSITSGSAYAVTVTTQPTGASCSVTNGSGTANANVTNVTVTCTATPTFTIGGTLSGLPSANSIILADNGAFDTLTLSANGTFTFPKSVTSGSAYAVTITTQPAGATCTVTNGSGTANANVTNVTVACVAAATFTIGGTVSGLSSGASVVLADNGSFDSLTVNANGTFTFVKSVASGAAYAVTVTTQPAGEICAVNNGSGTANANVTNVSVSCSTGSGFTIGGTLYDLSTNASSTGIVLQNNGGDSLTLATNGSFTFATPVTGAYAVTVSTQPSGPAQSCTVTNGSGTASANVTNVQVVCISEWSWINGANVVAVGGIYPSNTPIGPGSRFGAYTWTDSAGKFWLYGGFGYDVNGPILSSTTKVGAESGLGDLWNYDGSWHFKFGQAQNGQCFAYPTSVGQPGTPNGRSNGVSWIDAAGNLWMFGGYVSYMSDITQCPNALVADAFNDTWEFTGGQWVWQGPLASSNPKQSGSYGTKGSPGGTPGARYYSTGYSDASGNFWMFGGYGYDASSGNIGFLNDLWKFDGTQWTWISGSSTANQKGVYTGTPVPGSRYGASSWVDSSGNFWLFGGNGYDSTSTGIGDMNDLWKFTPSSGKWTFVGGSQTANGSAGTYGVQGVPASTNTPGSRVWSTTWVDANGDVWLMGGQYSPRADFFNDLWKYSGGQWTWMGPSGGSSVSETQFENVLGVYPASTGLPPSPSNAPGSRLSGAAWTDLNGNLWLFGGYGLGTLPVSSVVNVHSGFDSLQDLWEFQP